MRVFVLFVVTLSLVAAALPVAHGQVVDPLKILADAREALGGEQRLSAVKTFAASGRTRQVRGDNLVPIEFEIACELPDKFVRTDEIPAQESGPTTNGFSGEDLIQVPVAGASAAPPGAGLPPPSRAGGPPVMSPPQQDAARKARVITVKQDFARMALGMFATSFSSYPLTFTYLGQAEAPQGKADVIQVSGAGNFSARLFVNSQTHLPLMVSWEGPAA